MKETDVNVKTTHNGKDITLTYKLNILKGTGVQNKLKTKSRKEQTADEIIQELREKTELLPTAKNTA